MKPQPFFLPSDPEYRLPRFSPTQAAAHLDLSKDAIYRRVRHGDIAHVKYGAGSGALVKFTQADLDAWLEAQRVPVRRGPVTRLERLRPVEPLPGLPPIRHRHFS